MNNNAFNVSMLSISNLPPAESNIVFFEGHGTQEIMKFEGNGNIYYKGRLLVTDQEIVEGLRSLIFERSCPKCKEWDT